MFPRAVVLSILVIMTYLFIQTNGKAVKKYTIKLLKKPWLVSFLFYVAVLMVITIFNREITNPFKKIFADFGLYIEGKINLEFIENLILFIPYTFLYSFAFRPHKPFKTAFFVSIYTSCAIETIQLLLWLGEFQISDIIHNIIGGILGSGLYYLVLLSTRVALKIASSLFKHKKNHYKKNYEK